MPSRRRRCAAISVQSAVYIGATAEVPPVTRRLPPATTFQPVRGSALPEPSGRPRPETPSSAERGRIPAASWYGGTAKTRLTPLPATPAPLPSSFHTTSRVIRPAAASTAVPPQAQTAGDEAGNSACCRPSVSALVEPASPAAALYVT